MRYDFKEAFLLSLMLWNNLRLLLGKACYRPHYSILYDVFLAEC